MKRRRTHARSADGFTMLELLVALSILVVAFTIIWTTFSTTIKAWRRGSQLVDELHHGDFVMEQLVAALRSAAYFHNRPDKFGFWLMGRGEQDELSWVTAGSAFMPPGSPLAQGLHRIWVSIESNDDGDDAFTVRAFPHLQEEIEKDDAEAWYISSRIKGLDCRTWNSEDEAWDDEWEDTNKVPGLVEITLFLEPLEKYGAPVKISRLVELPIGPAVTSITASATGTPTPGGVPTGAPAAGTGGAPGEGQQNTGGGRAAPPPGGGNLEAAP